MLKTDRVRAVLVILYFLKYIIVSLVQYCETSQDVQKFKRYFAN